MIAVPAETPVTIPVLSTVATAGLLLANVPDLITVLIGVNTALNVAFAPTETEDVAGNSSTLVAFGPGTGLEPVNVMFTPFWLKSLMIFASSASVYL